MAASYQNLWIIVGMTVTATVLANMSAKPKRSATPSYEVSHLEPNLPSAGTTSGPSNPSTIAAARTANPDKGTATAPASTRRRACINSETSMLSSNRRSIWQRE